MFDILAALSDDASRQRGNNRCALGKFLDTIPADAPGRDELVALIETKHDKPVRGGDTISANDAAALLRHEKIGYDTSDNPILDHRAQRCRCYR